MKIRVDASGERCEEDVEPPTLLVHGLREEVALAGLHIGWVG